MTSNERKLVNLDVRLKCIVISYLSDDTLESVVKNHAFKECGMNLSSNSMELMMYMKVKKVDLKKDYEKFFSIPK